MAASTATRVRKRVSKNKKRSWRKHTDIEDVEEHLADERLQLRTGGLVVEKADDELFFVDTKVAAGEVDAKEDKPTFGRRKRVPKELKCHSVLLPDPKIKPVKLPRAASTKQLPLRPSQVKTAKKRRLDVVKARQVARQQRQANRIPYSQKITATYNLWSSQPQQPVADDAVQPDEHYLAVTRKLPVKAPSHHHKKPSEVPAVEVAHPGSSYNPTYDDHQLLLQSADQFEAKKLRDEKRLERQLDGKFPDARDAPTQESWLHEMSAGLFDGDAGHEEQSGGNDDQRLSLNPPVVRDSKKTKKKRNLEEELAQKEQAAQAAAEAKRRDKDVFRLRSMQAEIKADEAKRQARLAARRQRALIAETLGTRKLGPKPFDEPAPELHLTEDLASSLRLLKPGGNLLEDRFKSLQKRNIIEPRTRMKRVLKYKRKEYEKRSHRDM